MLSVLLARFVLRHIASVIGPSWLAVFDDTRLDGGGRFMFWSDWLLLLWVAFTGLGVVVLLTLALLGTPSWG